MATDAGDHQAVRLALDDRRRLRQVDLEVLTVDIVATQLRGQDRGAGLLLLAKGTLMRTLLHRSCLDLVEFLRFGLRWTNFDGRIRLFVRNEHRLGFLRGR